MIDKVLLKFLGKDKKKIFFITFINLLNLLISVSLYALLALFIYQIVNSQFESITYLILTFFLLIALKILFSLSISKSEASLGREVKVKLRNDVLSKIFSFRKTLPYNSEALAQLGIEGVEQLNLYYSVYLPQFFYALIGPIILFIIFCFIDLLTAFIFLICVPLIPLSIILVSKYAKKIFNKYWDKYLSMGGDFYDSLMGMKELKIFNADLRQQEKLDQNAEEFRKVTMKVLVMQLYSTSLMDLIAYGGAAVGLLCALISFFNGGITNFALVIFIILVGSEFFLPMRYLGSAFHISMNGASAGKKILEILNYQEEKKGNVRINDINNITFKNVSLTYEGSNNKALNNVSFNFSRSGLYGIAGASGGGKSTIVRLLSKESLMHEGQILIDDINLSSIEESSYFNLTAFISYNSHLFNKTVRENFHLINPLLSDEEILNLLKLVRLDSLSLDYKLSEDTTNLSGGQKQRMVLAIYLSLDKKVYIFDEATSNIDNESEEIINSLIQKLSQDKLVIVISHHLRNLQPCNEILYLKHGEIKERGNFASLIKDNQEFASLYQKQKQIEGDLYA